MHHLTIVTPGKHAGTVISRETLKDIGSHLSGLLDTFDPLPQSRIVATDGEYVVAVSGWIANSFTTRVSGYDIEFISHDLTGKPIEWSEALGNIKLIYFLTVRLFNHGSSK